MAYATIEDVEKGYKDLDADERVRAEALLDRAAVIIDTVAEKDVSDDAKKLVSCNMVTRAIASLSGSDGIPIGVSQGTQTGLGYTSSYTFGSGSSGELYLTKMDKRLLHCGNRIGSHSPIEDLTEEANA
jgi:hypothetical protein